MSTKPADIALPNGTAKAYFGLGCFWAPDGQFPAEDGVLRTRVGYAGGAKKDPTYRNIMDHTEVIEVEYDPRKTDYKKMLDCFWRFHDPTAVEHHYKNQSNQRQYISLILYASEAEKAFVDESKSEIAKQHRRPIVTQVAPFDCFYEAEGYHQKYHLQCDAQIMSAFGLRPSDLCKSVLAAKLNAFVMGYAKRETLDYLNAHTKLSSEQQHLLEDLLASGGTGASCHT